MEQQLCTVVELYKGKGDDLERADYRVSKTDQVLKVIKRIKTFTGEMVDINETQFDFLPLFAARNNIVILRQLQRKYFANKDEFVLSLYRFGERF